MVREHGAGDEIAALAFSPTYASPEQIQGGPLSVQSDIYSLGVILRKLLSEPVRKPGQTNASAPLPYELEAVVARASALDPDQRYASVSEFQQDLKKYIAKIHDEAVGKLSQLIASYPADSRVIAAKEKLDAKIHADTLNALVATIEQTMDAGDLDCAATMLTDAQMRFPLDQALSPLIARLERAIAKRKEDESTQRSAEIAYKPVAESGDQETHTANDNGLASSEHLRAGALPLRQHASKRSSNRLAQGKQPVAPSTPPQTKTRSVTQKPASRSKTNKTKGAFHPVQRYTIIGLVASLVLVLLFVGHLLHPGHPPNPSPAEARVVIVSNPSEAAIHVEGNARSVDCVPPPMHPFSTFGHILRCRDNSESPAGHTAHKSAIGHGACRDHISAASASHNSESRIGDREEHVAITKFHRANYNNREYTTVAADAILGRSCQASSGSCEFRTCTAAAGRL